MTIDLFYGSLIDASAPIPTGVMERMHIAYYITGHGYGHALRSATIIRNLAPSTQVTIISTVPEHFFGEELGRPFSYRCEGFDCGCIQSDSVTVDVPETIRTYCRIASENKRRLVTEVDWCLNQKISGIVGDIPPFVFEVALTAGLPSVAVTNFTWYDIYREYDTPIDDASIDLKKMREQYASATGLFALYPALPMTYFQKRHELPVVARRGNLRRTELCHRFDVGPENKLALIYIGNFGMSKAGWWRLALLTGWEFFGLQEIPGAPSNYHQIAKADLWYPDVIASVDCVVSKLGYGVVGECMVNGTPIVYLPRPLFAEYPVLEQAVLHWGGGVELSSDRFYNLDWKAALKRVCRGPRPSPLPASGAVHCAASIERLFS